MNKPLGWYKATANGPASYVNACSTDTALSVPINYGVGFNYQYAKDGDGYVGMFYLNTANQRNYYQTKLKDSLKTGHRYYAEYYVSVVNSVQLACNNQAILFTNKAVYVDTLQHPYGVLPANPQIVNYSNPIIDDTLNWVKVSGVITAQGGEQYLTLGNFKYDTQTVFKQFQPTGYYGAGYNVDAVSVYALDSFNLKADAGRDTTITIGDSAFIGTYTNGIDTLKWQIQNTSNKIDSTRPGFWVYPTSNTCYVLTQTVNGYTSSDTVCVNVNPLPLKFISYELALQNTKQSVENIWTTANEISVNYFNVLHSINGKDFINIGKVAARNNSYNEYSFIDETPNEGVNYYKIMSVDKDGNASYSETKKISIINSQLSINVFPNPATTTINITSQQNIQQIKLINQLGQTIQKYNNPNQPLTINCKLLTKGVYIVQAVLNNGIITNQKLVIQ
jgi:hypothetical protein